MAKTKVLKQFVVIAVTVAALISLSVALSVPAYATHKLSYIKEKSGFYILLYYMIYLEENTSLSAPGIRNWSDGHRLIS